MSETMISPESLALSSMDIEKDGTSYRVGYNEGHTVFQDGEEDVLKFHMEVVDVLNSDTYEDLDLASEEAKAVIAQAKSEFDAYHKNETLDDSEFE